MTESLAIELHNLRFFSFHGLYPEEQKMGNEFEVSVTIHFSKTKEILSINETIDYLKCYGFIKKQMAIRQDLVETVGINIAQDLKQHFPIISKVLISIKKLTPPILNFIGTVGVTYTREFPNL